MRGGKLTTLVTATALVGSGFNSLACSPSTLVRIPSSTSVLACSASHRPIEVLTAQEIVLGWRTGGLPIAVIADIARVERKSVYAWIKGGRVHQSNLKRFKKILIDCYVLISRRICSRYIDIGIDN